LSLDTEAVGTRVQTHFCSRLIINYRSANINIDARPTIVRQLAFEYLLVKLLAEFLFVTVALLLSGTQVR